MKLLVKKLGVNAKNSFSQMLDASTLQKNQALSDLSEEIYKNSERIILANEMDILQAERDGFDEAFIDRLTIDQKVIDSMRSGLSALINLPDPVGKIDDLREQPSGIMVGSMRVPIGVVLIIYESRPNVTIDAAALCLKSGNAVILRGGSESLNSNTELVKLCKKVLKKNALPQNAIQIVPKTDRSIVGKLIEYSEMIDLIIPRGGKSLIEKISKDALIPVIKHLDGICHVYIDDDADLVKATNITLNSKTQRLATCNTLETLLISEKISKRILPKLALMLMKKNVELRVCEKSKEIIKALSFEYSSAAKIATARDWKTEYLSNILSIKIVTNIEAAIKHISKYGSQHTDSIITENHHKAMLFLRKVDSASVMVNASTRFADGFQYGLGAEIGISTNKLHARGPVGLEGLTSEKYIVEGNGQLRA